MSEQKIVLNIAEDRSIEISTGKMAKLAGGACVLRMGDTVLLVTVCSAPAKPGADFLPLQVDYREKYSAAGKFPGGFIKREGRPTDKEILTCRFTDRPVRPLFPKGFYDEIQIQAIVLSADGANDPDVLCALGASAALTLSDLPFNGPIGALRVGCVDGKFIANPTHEEMAKSSLELIYAGLPDKVIMIEGDADECSEELLAEAMRFANEIVKKQVAAQLELAAKAGTPKKTPTLYLVPEAIQRGLVSFCAEKIESVCLIPGKNERLTALDELHAAALEHLKSAMPEISVESLALEVKKGFDDLVKDTIRKAILEKQYRPDGRGSDEIRQLTADAAVLPIVHGSGMFTRGETQALVITTLGGEKDSQDADSVTGPSAPKRFYLHYNFPNFSVGEVGRITGPGRREIGHGNLAERSIAKVIPNDYPYVVRCVSEVMSSNGSTSMATVCAATLALMDAGIQIKAPVAGISCGLVTGDGKEVLLTDIIGAEDHFGDMDFKVCGTRQGITGFQLDLKLPGVSIDLLCRGMERNKAARMKILDVIQACIPAPRPELSERAPRMEIVKISTDKIGALIGPGGKNIKSITEATESSIDINDDGTVKILAPNKEALEKAKNLVIGCTAEAEIGKVYRGKVVSIRDFGAFVEILPGQDGLLHISEMANYRVKQVSDVCQEGSFVTVKVIDIDSAGRVRLSRRAALEEIEKEKE